MYLVPTKMADQTDRPVVFTSKVAYLSKADGVRAVIIPKYLRAWVGKSTVFQVILKPIGSIGHEAL